MKTSTWVTMLIMAAVLAVTTVVPAVIQGNYANRWGAPADLIAAAERLQHVPERFGDWVKESAGRPMSDLEKGILHAYASNNNSYRNQATGQRIDIILTVGPAGPIVRHNPEFCYECRNAVHLGESSQLKVEVPGYGENSLRAVRFRSPGAVASEFEIAYGWSNGGRWSRPQFPRVDFGGDSLIFGLQLFTDELSREESKAAFESFMRDFVPAVSRTVLLPHGAQESAAN